MLTGMMLGVGTLVFRSGVRRSPPENEIARQRTARKIMRKAPLSCTEEGKRTPLPCAYGGELRKSGDKCQKFDTKYRERMKFIRFFHGMAGERRLTRAGKKSIMVRGEMGSRHLPKEETMSKKQKIIFWSVVPAIIVLLIVGIILTNGLYEREASIQETMQDAILHEGDRISLFGLPVNPGLISAYLVTGAILLFAAIVRIFVIPKFKRIPGKFQLVLEQAVGFFDGMARSNSPHRNNTLGAYIFAAGVYIFFGTLFELVGIPWQTANGTSVTLPAPLSDINGAIALGCLSYAFILVGGIRANKGRGLLGTLKEFSLPISMSFRLFGALLSGMLVTELVYYYLALSFVLPVVVGVLFTLLHALVQAYVLAMLTALIYGEVTEPHVKIQRVRTRKNKTKSPTEVKI